VGNRKEHTGCVTQGSRAGVTSVYIIQCTVHGATAVLRMPSELVTSISGKRRRSQAPHLLSPSAFSLRFSQPILEKGEPNASCYSSRKPIGLPLLGTMNSSQIFEYCLQRLELLVIGSDSLCSKQPITSGSY
jgi:hypothetical protein